MIDASKNCFLITELCFLITELFVPIVPQVLIVPKIEVKRQRTFYQIAERTQDNTVGG
jgi:hypothetical protein